MNDIELFIISHIAALGSFILLHTLRNKITLAPLLVSAGLGTFMIWQINQTGWWVPLSSLQFHGGTLSLAPAVIAAGVCMYAMDGVALTRAYIGCVLTGSVCGIAFLKFLSLLEFGHPLPSLFRISLWVQIGLLIGLLCAVIAACLSYEGLRRVSRFMALLFAIPIGLVMLAAISSIIAYEPNMAMVNFVLTVREHLLAAIPATGILLVYGSLAARHRQLMPIRPITEVLTIWRRQDQELVSAREDALTSRHIVRELRSLNDRLEEERELRRHQVYDSPVAVLEVDQRGRIVAANPAVLVLLNIPKSALLQHQQAELFLPGFQYFFTNPKMVSQLLTVTISNEQKQFDVTVMHSRMFIGNSDAEIILSAIIRDVSKREHEHRRSLICSRVQNIHQTGRAIFHDFTNLLIGLEGNLSMLEGYSKVDDERVSISVQSCQEAVRRGRELLTQISSGKPFSVPELCVVPADGIINEAIRLHAAAAHHRNIKLVATIEPNLPAEIDQGQMLRVIVNLIGNALRATADGGRIAVNLSRKAAGISIEITDNGYGMSHDQLEMAFDPSFSTKGGGRGGIGLAISYLIVDAHGGRLELLSAPGVGTTAHVWLPLAILQKVGGLENCASSCPSLDDLHIVLCLPGYPTTTTDFIAETLESSGAEVAVLDDLTEIIEMLGVDSDEWGYLIIAMAYLDKNVMIKSHYDVSVVFNDSIIVLSRRAYEDKVGDIINNIEVCFRHLTKE